MARLEGLQTQFRGASCANGLPIRTGCVSEAICSYNKNQGTELAQPTRSTIKRLYALSGGECAFPGCSRRVVENGTLVGETCHIRGERPNSARYDMTQTEKERQGFDNLI